MSNQTTTFKNLPIGARFEFANDFPYSGMEKGPWRKVSPRKYRKLGDYLTFYQVGSIHTKVVPIHWSTRV